MNNNADTSNISSASFIIVDAGTLHSKQGRVYFAKEINLAKDPLSLTSFLSDSL